MAEAKRQNLNAVTLVRVSTKKQGDLDRFGMNAQRESNRRIVEEHGFTVRKTVEYKDVSGDAVMYTDEMRDLQAFLRSPEMKGGNLVAKELSRLLRPNYTDYPLLQVFVDQRISIFLPQYVLQLWTPEGRMLAGVLCAVDFNEGQRIRERCMGGREASRKVGNCAAGSRTIPTGVTWDVKSKQWGYDPVYAPKIAEAFRLVAGGETNSQTIINKLRLTLRPANGVSKPATPTSLRRLLQNELFIGWRVITKKADLSISKEKLVYIGKDNKPHVRNRPLIDREEDEVLRHQVIKEPLVPLEVFEKVQGILRAKSDRLHQAHALHQSRPKFTYRGLLFCAECGQPLYTVHSGTRAYYKCRDQFPNRGGKQVCKAPSMRRERLEAVLDALFGREFPMVEFLAEVVKKHAGEESRKDGARRKAGLLAQQKTLTSKRFRVVEFGLDGKITTQDCGHRLKVVDDELDSIRRDLAELEKQKTSMPTAAEWAELWRPLRRGFAGRPVDEKRRLVSERFEKIMVRDYRVVNLYLLTGDVTTPEHNEADLTKCSSCQRRLSEPELKFKWNCCEQCMDGIAAEREERQQRQHRQVVHPGVFEFSATIGRADTSHRLYPLR